jgi:ABC-type multidrug transport system fused ATPase/permease subunit
VTGTSFLAMLRRLPALLAGASRLGWQASRRDTLLAVVLTATSGVFTALGVLATTDVAAALLTAGPTAERVRAALPSLLVVAASLSLRSVLGTAAGWAQARLEPKVLARSELQLVQLTTEVEAAAFDDPAFADELMRTRNRGTDAAAALVREGLNLLSALVGVAAATVALLLVHPVLVPLMLLAVAPLGWASVRSARIQYASLLRRVARQRRLWVLHGPDADAGDPGPWQRLAAARATFRDAPLLICDEPSAALDARAEHALFRQLRSRGGDRTTVLVSHRLANVRHVDRIYVLHEGRLVEQGSHDELMAAGGRYAELFTLQASGYR